MPPQHHITMKPILSRLTLALWCALGALPVQAAQTADIDAVRAATAKLISQLVDQGVLAKDKGTALLDEVAKPAPRAEAGTAATGKAAGSGTVRVQYIPDFVRNELKEEIRLELAAQAFREGWSGPGSVPSWVRNLQWEGDLRMRVQLDRFESGNASQISVNDTNRARTLQPLNTTEDRDRLRFRARFGLNVKIDENWSGGVRLTTGSSTDPLSANQTLGTYNNRYTVLMDRAYLRYRYHDQFNVVGGRFGNPWFGTDLLWHNDLSFDGIAGQWTPQLTERWRGFATLAAMPVQEVELSSADKWLFGGQVGASLSGGPEDIQAKVGMGYYHYDNIVGKRSPAARPTINEFTAPAFAQKGNTYYNISSDLSGRPLLGLASDYHLLNLTGQVDLPSYAGKRVILTGDYVRNLGFDKNQVSQRALTQAQLLAGTQIDEETTAYQLRAAFGDVEMKKLHDWQVFVAYKHVERDALLDAFTDSDFRLGGTDAKGYILGGSYGLAKNTYATFRYLSADSISGAPLSVDVFQFDLNVKF